MLLPIFKNQSGVTTNAVVKPTPFSSFAISIAENAGEEDVISATPSVGFRNLIVTQSNPIEENPYCTAPAFVEQQIPFWIKQNYTNTDESYLVAFLKEYYNWLYCGFKTQEFKATPYDIEIILDIDQAPDGFLDYFVKQYAPFIELESPNLKRENLRAFLNNIKTKFLSSKGTKASYDYVLRVLFDITVENISYPKLGVFRLNGGKFEFQRNQVLPSGGIYQEGIITNLPKVVSSGANQSSPGLNGGVLNDNNFWQDYSYLLQTTASVEESKYYANTILNSVHPAGTKPFFEQYVPLDPIDFGNVDDNTDTAVPPVYTKEVPVIKNYLKYYPDYTLASGSIATCACCDDYCDPSGGTDLYPVHAIPTWASNIPDNLTYFSEITIGDFIELYPAEDSPNAGIDDCTSCGA